MNLSLLQRPRKIRPGTNTMYIYYPAVVTTNDVLEPGTVLKILDVFEGDSISTTTLKVVSAKDWDSHRYGRAGVSACSKDSSEEPGEELCDCQKELSEMSDAFKELVHYVLLSDVGK
ncbi:hypothetical protein LCGC14_0207960 [marine sediment metagenome]|uniref:Uncharacterized protein n=1 Tax=marine sediment metagenome TaxID=412755 RepID=A0A0F9UGH7_9ZZZZ